MRQFVSSYGESNYVAHEVVSAIRIAAEMLPRMETLGCVRDCITLLLECAQQSHFEEVAAEFVQLYVVDMLDNAKDRWSRDEDCRVCVSRMLWELSKSDLFTKSNSLVDIDPVLCATYRGERSFEICDNITATVLQIVTREAVPSKTLISLPIWRILLKEALSIDSNVITSRASPIPPPSARKAAGAATRAGAGKNDTASTSNSPIPTPRTTQVDAANMKNDTQKAAELRDFNTKSSVLSLLAYSVHDMLLDCPDMITKALVVGICRKDLMDHTLSYANLLVIISALSEVSQFCSYLLDGHIFSLLGRYVTNMVGTSKLEKAQLFCATFLHNLSLHSNLVVRFVSNSDGSLCELIQEILEIPNDLVSLRLSVFFFHSAGFLVKHQQSLNPKFVLDMINRLSNISGGAAAAGTGKNDKSKEKKETDLSSINKYTISMILNKYQFGTGVDPSYVQYMFSYMQQNQGSAVPPYMETVTFEKMNVEPKLEAMIESLRYKFSETVDLETFEPSETLWLPTASTETKQHDSIILKFSQACPVSHDSFESGEDASTIFTFHKIVKEFSALREKIDGGDNNAITEGDEEEDDDDEEEGEEEGEEGGGDDADGARGADKDTANRAGDSDSIAAMTALSLEPGSEAGSTTPAQCSSPLRSSARGAVSPCPSPTPTSTYTGAATAAVGVLDGEGSKTRKNSHSSVESRNSAAPPGGNPRRSPQPPSAVKKANSARLSPQPPPPRDKGDVRSPSSSSIGGRSRSRKSPSPVPNAGSNGGGRTRSRSPPPSRGSRGKSGSATPALDIPDGIEVEAADGDSAEYGYSNDNFEQE